MQSIKSYTDLEQSKKLAEFLPLESADMWYHGHGSPLESEREYDSEACHFHSMKPNWDIPCWSLAALLNVIPISYKDEGQYCFALINTNPSANPVEWCACYEDCYGNMIMECYADNSIDTCYELILKLHELKML